MASLGIIFDPKTGTVVPFKKPEHKAEPETEVVNKQATNESAVAKANSGQLVLTVSQFLDAFVTPDTSLMVCSSGDFSTASPQ